MTKDDYEKILQEISRDTSNFENIKGTLTGKALLGAISNDIYIQYEIKHVFVVKPTFAKYTEVDEIYHRVIKLNIPDEERWEKLCEFQE